MGADDNTVYVHNTKAKKFHSMVHKPSKPDGISSGFVSSIFQENDSIFWLGLNGNGLNRLNLISGVAKKLISRAVDKFQRACVEGWADARLEHEASVGVGKQNLIRASESPC